MSNPSWANTKDFSDLSPKEQVEQARLKRLIVTQGAITLAWRGWETLSALTPDAQEQMAAAGRFLRQQFPGGELYSKDLSRESALGVRDALNALFPGKIEVYYRDEEAPV